VANVLQSISTLLSSSLEETPGGALLPEVLSTLRADISQLLAVSLSPDGDALEGWLATLRRITGDVVLRESLLVRFLQMNAPRAAEALVLAGVVKVVWVPNAARPHSFGIDWNQFGDLTSTPGTTALDLLLGSVKRLEDIAALQGLILLWIANPVELVRLETTHQGFLSLPLPDGGFPGVSTNDLQKLIDAVHSPLRLPLPFTAGLSFHDLIDELTQPPKPPGPLGSLAVIGGNTVAQPITGLGLDIELSNLQALLGKSVAITDRWTVTFEVSSGAAAHLQLVLNQKGIDPAIHSDATVSVFLERLPAPGDDAHALMLGKANGTHFSVGVMKAGLTFHTDVPLFSYEFRFDPIEFGVAPDFLSFLSFGSAIPTSITLQSLVNLAYEQGVGLTVKGAGGGLPSLGADFSVHLGLNLGVPGIRLSVDDMQVRIEVAVANGAINFRVMMRYSARAEVGPLSATMAGAGLWFGRWTGGNLGLLPPTSIGLTVKAGPIEGGGFVASTGPNEYAGALQLKIVGVGAFAYGIYSVLPDGTVSFVALIGIRLPFPGIQISFGFAVSGFGGLVGINREANTDLLRERLVSGSAGDVLFNDNPMKNAPKLLGDMRDLFPAKEGVFLIGPTLQLNWLSLFTLNVGLFIELPGPSKVFLAGSARLVVGSEDFALVYLRLDFIGGIDFTKSLVFFDGALVNSQVLGFITITGGLALRMCFGVNGYFLFSVGGFNPSFNPANLELPKLARAGAGFDLGIVWFKEETYLAITSNTFQFGSNTEAGIEIGPLSAHGWFRFDALIQLKPFHFDASVEAGFDIEFDGWSFCSVRVRGVLSGPGPLVLHAEASVHLIVRISKSVTLTLDANPPENLPTIPNLALYLAPELSTAANLRTEGADPSVVFAAAQGTAPLLSPVGDLVWEQRRVPLDLSIQKAEGIALGGSRTLTVSSGRPSTPETDVFGTGTYSIVNDADALNNPRFSQADSGMRISADSGSTSGPDEYADLTITIVRLPKKIPVMGQGFAFLVPGHLSVMLGERATGAPVRTEAPVVLVSPELWSSRTASSADSATGPVLTMGLTPAQAMAESRTSGAISMPAGTPNMNLAGVLS